MNSRKSYRQGTQRLSTVRAESFWNKCRLPYWEKDMDGNYVKKDIKEIRFEDFNVEDFQKDKITHYIQHPVPVKNEYIEKMNKISLPMFLTKKERKRLRKLRRQEKEKEKQEKMKLGLIEPPKPKLKFKLF